MLTVIFQLLTGMTVYSAKEENLALSAKPSVSSCDASNKIYTIEMLNDGITGHSFAPLWSSSNQNLKDGNVWATLEWSNPIKFNRIKLYTVRNYELKDYDIQIDETYTTKDLRILCWSGPDIQDYIARLTGIEVFSVATLCQKRK